MVLDLFEFDGGVWEMKHEKPWYQYRYEEANPFGDEGALEDLQTVFIFTSLASRLKRFLFVEAHLGGVRWIFEASWSDWRWVYGHEIE